MKKKWRWWAYYVLPYNLLNSKNKQTQTEREESQTKQLKHQNKKS